MLGGTFQEGDSNLEIDQVTRWDPKRVNCSDEIVRRCIEICPDLEIDGEPLKIIESKVGLRPTRHGGIRLEGGLKGEHGQVLLIHNYGQVQLVANQ